MTWSLIILIVIFIALLLTASVRPVRASLSQFELERRIKKGDKSAAAAARREQLLADIRSLQRVSIALLLVVFAACSVGTFGWLFGVILAVVVALEYGSIARLRLVQRVAQRGYEKIEPFLLRMAERVSPVTRFIRSNDEAAAADARIDSKEELLHLLEDTGNALTAKEKARITHGLSFADTAVRDIMTPRSMIDTIAAKELLGPAVLDELHKTGHSRIPVIDADVDHIVGILYVRELLTLDKKRSVTAAKAMDQTVYYIQEQQTAEHALAAFTRTHHHLFVVVNEYRETVGIITLEDVLESLIGSEIIDEFDEHDDLRKVAARNPRGNNTPPNASDV